MYGIHMLACMYVHMYQLQDVTELMVRLLIHLRVTPDRKAVEAWLGDHMGNLAAWISFWPFFIVTVQKCLGPRGAQATSRAVQALHEEIVDEVNAYKCI